MREIFVQVRIPDRQSFSLGALRGWPTVFSLVLFAVRNLLLLGPSLPNTSFYPWVLSRFFFSLSLVLINLIEMDLCVVFFNLLVCWGFVEFLSSVGLQFLCSLKELSIQVFFFVRLSSPVLLFFRFFKYIYIRCLRLVNTSLMLFCFIHSFSSVFPLG